MFVREWDSSVWKWIHCDEWKSREDANPKISAFAETRSLNTVLEQFGSIDNFYDYINSN